MQRPHPEEPQRRVLSSESSAPFPSGRMIGPVSSQRFEGEGMSASSLQYPLGYQ